MHLINAQSAQSSSVRNETVARRCMCARLTSCTGSIDLFFEFFSGPSLSPHLSSLASVTKGVARDRFQVFPALSPISLSQNIPKMSLTNWRHHFHRHSRFYSVFVAVCDSWLKYLVWIYVNSTSMRIYSRAWLNDRWSVQFFFVSSTRTWGTVARLTNGLRMKLFK